MASRTEPSSEMVKVTKRLEDWRISTCSLTRHPTWQIIQTYPGADGHVRMADVKLKDTVLKRPVMKLCPIEKEH